ncbi:hypothetical protein B0A53_01877 [Rhodotorula sp. CCFEE 5036]|nr:hypothetical protein B0A53_01877 [Rhodotorula sp. CCFEE 5036]
MPPRRPPLPATQGGTEAGPSSKKRCVEAAETKSNTRPAQKKTPSLAKSSSKSGSSGAADVGSQEAIERESKQQSLDKCKGKGRTADSNVESVESEGNKGTDDESAAEAREQQEEIDFERVEEEKPSLIRKYLEEVVEAYVKANLTDTEKLKHYLDLWEVCQRLEALRNAAHFEVKLDNGNVRLEKKLTWQLPEPKLERRAPQGEDVSTLERFTRSRRKHHLTYGGLLFLFLLITAPHWIKIYQSAAKADKKGKLMSWRADPKDFVCGVAMKDCNSSCVYMLVGLLAYFGMTGRSGRERLEEHIVYCVSIAMARARKDLAFKKWKKEAIYVPPGDLALTFPAFVLFFYEHLAITASDATGRGVKVKAFDAAGWEHIITARELKGFVELVLNTLLPLKEGIRVPTGFHLSHVFFIENHDKFFKVAPLMASTMEAIFMGRRWAFHTRNVFKDTAVDDSIWAKQKRLIRLLATRAERDVAYKALLDVKDRSKNVDGWDTGKEISRSMKKTPPRQKQYPAVRNQKGDSGDESVSAAQSGGNNKAGLTAETEASDRYWEKKDRNWQVVDHGEQEWVEHDDVDFGY